MGGRWPRCFPFDEMDGWRDARAWSGSVRLLRPGPQETRKRRGGAAVAVYSPRGGAQRVLPRTNVEQIPLRKNIAHRQPITPALAARGGCRRSGLAQKCCLRLAFAFDSDME